jgi:hypothetical protein
LSNPNYKVEVVGCAVVKSKFVLLENLGCVRREGGGRGGVRGRGGRREGRENEEGVLEEGEGRGIGSRCTPLG